MGFRYDHYYHLDYHHDQLSRHHDYNHVNDNNDCDLRPTKPTTMQDNKNQWRPTQGRNQGDEKGRGLRCATSIFIYILH